MLPTPPRSDEDEITRTLLDALWQRLIPQTKERLDLLDRASAAATNQTLTPELQAEAAATAHKFAGSLGMFGFHEGTRLALQLEEQLVSPAPDPLVLSSLTQQLHCAIQEPSASVFVTPLE